MKMSVAIEALLNRQDLPAEAMRALMRQIMSGDATPAQIGGFLVALRAKGETIEEVVAAVEVLREMSLKVHVDTRHLIDTCGTGGDGAHTFNISTASAFVAAAAGARVAKHGSRSVSSRTGSADVLEAAGINLHLDPEAVAHCISDVGLGFLFAQNHHGAMRHAVGPRRELGVRTLFNLLGPLSNPAGAPNQLIGVFSAEWIEPLAQVLKVLGSRHVMVVHAEDGLDEISIGAPTRVAELIHGEIRVWTLTPEQFGLQRASLETLAVDSSEQSLAVIRRIFSGEAGPHRDIVLLNAGAAIYCAGVAETLEAGLTMARAAIDHGAAQQKLDDLIRVSTSLTPAPP